MGSFKNIPNATLKKADCLDKMIAFSVMIIFMLLACVFLDVSGQELGRPIFLEDIFGLTPNTNHIEFVFSDRPLSGQCRLVNQIFLRVNCIDCTKNYLLAGCDDGTVRVCDFRTNTLRHSFKQHQNAVTCLQHEAHSNLFGSLSSPFVLRDRFIGFNC
jgi:hypothetical protein